MKLPPEIPDAEDPDVKEPHAAGGETTSMETRAEEDESALGEVLAHLRASTGHDFSHYKRATVLRRIARRLQVNSLESIPRYLAFLRQHPAEARALLADLLIGVIHFFRDRESFAALEANIPQLFAGKKRDEQIRVWVAGCATGEEAYSIAILLCEHASRLESPPSIQVFASDIDDEAIQNAREGLYPSTIEEDVSPTRLRQFFDVDHGRYRVRKEIREKVLFASHNLLKDAPFSRLDLISCRNLLIYLKSAAQDEVFNIFHFALRSGGLLFVGSSEATSNVQSLFSSLDAKHRVYVRRSVPRPSWKVPVLPLRTPGRATAPGARPRPLPPLPAASFEAGATHSETRGLQSAGQERRANLFGELHLKLLEQYGPPSAVVNETHDIVHLSEHAGRYLKFAAGEPTANLLSVVHPALRNELRTALFRVAKSKESITAAPQTVELDQTREVIRLEVRPMVGNDSARGYYLVLFEKQADTAAEAPEGNRHELAAHEREDEIEFLKAQLSATVEQADATSEELMASNEELQAMNEEMRSATEELETSKEELQSVNEELTTVNHELKSSVEELSRANADLNNLMASTDIGTIFLDRELRIQRFTPSAQKIFNLLPADLGRPLSDITHKLAYDGLSADVETVLRDLATLEREVSIGEKIWFLTRIAPYRTAGDRIAGVVATFIDITRRRTAEDELKAVSDQMATELDRFNITMTAVPDFIYHFDLAGRFTYANQSLLNLWRKTLDQVVGRNFHDLDYPPELADRLQRQIEEVITTRQRLRDETPYIASSGERLYEYIFFPLLEEGGSVSAVAGVTRDITERKLSEQALLVSEERFRQFAENSADVFWIVDAATGRLEYLNPITEQMWGEARANLIRDPDRWRALVHPEDRSKAAAAMPRVLAGEVFTVEYRIVRPNDGELRWIRDTGFPIRNEAGDVYRVAGVAQDVTADRARTEALIESEERFRLLVESAHDYAIFLLDPGNRIIYWSAGAERVFGWSAEEALGESGELIFTPEDRAHNQEDEELRNALQHGVASDCRWHLRKDGSRVWIEGVMRRLDDEAGHPRGFAKIARDASDHRRFEDELRAGRDELERRVVERTRDLVSTNKELERTMSQRQELERELLEISEREKRRIGEDLHDGVCQELTATALFLKASSNKVAVDSPEAAAVLEESAQIVNRNVGLTRDLARGLQPADLTGVGLKDALRALASQTGEKGEMKCHFRSARGVRVTDDNIALHLYRVAQEAVKNAVKHSGAENMLIVLDKNSENVCVTVEDDGKGFTPRRRSKGLGLHIMRYRASALGGHLKIAKRKSGGTSVTCVIPIKR